jgi:hypothetical protein
MKTKKRLVEEDKWSFITNAEIRECPFIHDGLFTLWGMTIDPMIVGQHANYIRMVVGGAMLVWWGQEIERAYKKCEEDGKFFEQDFHHCTRMKIDAEWYAEGKYTYKDLKNV